ncbi:zinc-binding dehydrogenase [Pseudoalteromonas piscicida]|uniref:zinc-binding dehydrogenase n=1 Tax=Pseudoalteromonas piscicida TaxID=43662 RepID=UPI00309BAD3A
MINEATTYGVYEFGDNTQLCCVTRACPPLSAAQVRVKVLSTSVNPIEVKTRQGLGYVAAQKDADAFLPLGYDLYGEVVEVFASHSQFQVGQHVIGMVGFASNPGTYSDYITANEAELLAVSVQENDAVSGLCLAGLTAKQALDKFTDTERPLYILAPTGGVGHLAIQLAQLQGRKVVAVSTRPEHSLLAELKVTAISYDDFYQRQQQCDLLDLIGGDIALQCLTALSPGSHLVTIPTVTKEKVCEQAIAGGVTAEGMLVAANLDDLKYLYQAYQAGKISINVSHYFALADIALAHSCMENAEHVGKVIIKA